MKRVLKFLLFIILIFALSKMNGDVSSWVDIATYISFILSFVVLFGGFYYLVKVKKAKFILFIVSALLFMQPAFAQIDLSDIQAADSSNFRISDLGSDVCKAKREGHLDLKALKKAQAIINYWNKKGVSPSILGGGDNNYECARSYIKYAAALGIAARATCSPSRVLLKTAAEKDKCWPCDVTATILAGIQKMSVKSYHAINNAAKITLGVGYLFWLSITILVSFAKFGFEKFGEFFSKLLGQTIIVMIIALILQAPLSQFYRATISPFISFSAALSMRISEETIGLKKSTSLFDKIISKVGLANTGKCSYCNKIKNVDSGLNNFIGSDAINAILCLTCTTYKQTAPMIAIGQNLVCLGRNTPSPVINDIPVLNTVTSFIGPNYQVAIFGLILVLIFSILTFLIGYFISTSVLKLGVVLVLMPFFLVAFAFKSTRIYANKAWGLVVFSMANILIVSVSISFVTIGFSSLMPTPSALNFVNFFLHSSGGEFANLMGGSNLANDITLNAEGFKKLAGMVGASDATFRLLSIAAFSYIGIHIISNSSSITEQLTNAWQLNASEGRILANSLIEGSKRGIAGAKAVWDGTKIGAGLVGKVTHNGKKTTQQEVIDEAVRDLEKSEKNPRVIAPTQYTYDDKPEGTSTPPPPPTSKA
ncbi:MAG: hypothetical protein J6V53_03445 [Alphaproteobacteria bacterium]|nr:hypothetical protein [Alphaproteobacteria bacterium]